MPELMAHRVPPGGIIVVLTVGGKEGVVHLHRDGFDMIAPVVKVEPGKSKPPLLGAVGPVTDLDASGDGVALLGASPATDDPKCDRIAFVPVSDRPLQDAVPDTIDVVADLEGELRLFACPVVPAWTSERRGQRAEDHGGGEAGDHKRLGESS